ncbi:MAG TPA: hypothetical protein VND99_00085 [Candidatus Acidoferrales bacterium]|nr:hypothetical protein [Candidatus Acidoferrales bacterium]
MSLVESGALPTKLRTPNANNVLMQTFQREIRYYRDSSVQSSRTPRFLGIGTADTQQAYTMAVRAVYPPAECHFLSFNSTETSTAASQVVEMPLVVDGFKPYNSILTADVLPRFDGQLRTGDTSDRRLRFFKQASDVLEEFGMFVMVESTFDPAIIPTLIKAGFTSVAVHLPEESPSEITPKEMDKKKYAIVARKKIPTMD